MNPENCHGGSAAARTSLKKKRADSQRYRRGAALALLGGVLLTGAQSTLAAPPPISIPASSEENQASSGGLFGFLSGVNRSSALLGDLWGLRTELSRHGISLAIQETSEYLGNVTGGTKKGFEYDGLTQVLLQMDTQRAFGHYGGLVNVSLLNIHGRNLSADNLQTLQTASGIEADRATRLWELWYDQKFLEEDRLDVKIGQQSLDQEFMVSTNALYFVNTMFGWPMLPSANMPSGGPAYPLSALGARISARPVNGVTFLAGYFNGNPVKRDNGTDPQVQNRHGLGFPWGDGRLAIAELQFSYPSLGSMVEPGNAQPLGWTYRIGAWYNTKTFADQRIDQSGLSLADPNSDGNAREHRGNYAVYAVADQLIWRDGTDPNRTMALFGRVMGTPLKDRNLIDFSLNAGLVFHSPFRYRTADTFGVGVGYAHVSKSAAQLDRDNIAFGNAPPGPTRSSETFVELTYQYQLKPWIQLQPDLQYVFNPGAGVPNPDDPSKRIKNELVLGMRTNISF
ncbi:carbohydrate porin [Oryzomicrobium sp.]|uniref:carbohydrate porin n=1 Tax=Oryzomicrobium sp. TaxID=1911578 RepID=UPI002FE2F6C6